MLDLFTIFSKGGIVLWCFQGTCQSFTLPVNELIKSVILQERGGNNSFTHGSLALKFKLDNEFELVFVVAYQKILQLSYIDKLLSEIQLAFRNKYKDELEKGEMRNFEFQEHFNAILKQLETSNKKESQAPKKMRTFEESKKSQKTVASLKIDPKKEEVKNEKIKSKTGNSYNKTPTAPSQSAFNSVTPSSDDTSDELIRKNREKMMKKMGSKPPKNSSSGKGSPSAKKERKKEARVWENGGTGKEVAILDYSGGKSSEMNGMRKDESDEVENLRSFVGTMGGELKPMDYESDSEAEEIDVEENVEGNENTTRSNESNAKDSGGLFAWFKGLAGQKTLTKETVEPVLEKMREHLIAKNVASDIAEKLCGSVATKLEGKVLGTFSSVSSTVKSGLEESLVRILSPQRRVDILRDAMAAKRRGRPYSVTFCGVNGVGKSTNLAKICFWLLENKLRVMIAACDTFRAGAVEQLRTHVRKLNSLHPPEQANGLPSVMLYERGYGKDAASIAMDAINFAREQRFDVVLIDTAGRMQDNEPLMRSLSKLIRLNDPDLILFVGEALVGNEAVDQLTKFNQALADYSSQENPRLIDGILLTKFDTIDDKVGAAISMTYTTGQPIVFVGTGQTYTDLRNLNAKAVVHALLRA